MKKRARKSGGRKSRVAAKLAHLVGVMRLGWVPRMKPKSRVAAKLVPLVRDLETAILRPKDVLHNYTTFVWGSGDDPSYGERCEVLTRDCYELSRRNLYQLASRMCSKHKDIKIEKGFRVCPCIQIKVKHKTIKLPDDPQYDGEGWHSRSDTATIYRLDNDTFAAFGTWEEFKPRWKGSGVLALGRVVGYKLRKVRIKEPRRTICCPRCARRFKFRQGHIGRKVKCSKCSHAFQIARLWDKYLPSRPNELREMISTAISLNDVTSARCLLNDKSLPASMVLRCAALVGASEIVHALLKNGVDPNLSTDDREEYKHNTPLHIAVKFGHIDVVKLLLENGADPRIKSFVGKVIHPYDAIYYANNREMKLLIRTHCGEDPIRAELDIAFWEDDYETVASHLPEHIHLVTATLLHAAAEPGKLRFLQMFLEHGADVNFSEDDGRTALHHAIERGNIDAVKILLAAGADVNATRKYGCHNTALSMAIFSYKLEAVECLLAAGAKVGAKDCEHARMRLNALRAGEAEIRAGEAIHALLQRFFTP